MNCAQRFLILAWTLTTSIHNMYAAEVPLLTNVCQVLEAIDRKSWGRRFSFNARVTSPEPHNNDLLCVSDDSGHLVLHPNSSVKNNIVHGGDNVRVRGYVDLSQFCPACARLSKIEVLSHGTEPRPTLAKVSDVCSGKYHNQFIKVTGIVRDVFFDDIDHNYCILILESSPDRMQVVFPSIGVDEKKLDALLNAKISIAGLYVSAFSGTRRMIGCHLILRSISDIEVDDYSKDTLFDVQNLEDLSAHSADKISTLGRRRVFGKVIAAWGTNHFLIRYLDRTLVRVELAHGDIPHYGADIEAVGFPETDLYNVNLTRAVWKPTMTKTHALEPPQETTATHIFLDEKKQRRINMSYNGQVIRLRGIIRNAAASPDANNLVFMESDGFNIPIDLTSLPESISDLPIGSAIEATGVCVVDIENWRPNTILPRIKGVFLVPRIPDDIKILNRPSWWTPSRFIAAIGVLLTVLIGTLLWNNALRHKVERRSRELTQETVARVTSELKVAERTRLAMELHDSIVQNLTGASMEIRTAERIANEDNEGMHQHLSLAVKTLDSCRKDLRNCLWDLRNLTLEEGDVNDAIRRTLAPHIGNTELAVRFNVPRELFHDNTAHTILQIIRELTINAIQHGKATSIKVAGSIENDKLLFSVKDNGCGFNPESAPGMAQGHFGLQGIRDRIENFEGEMSVQSAPGKGSRILISLSVPQSTNETVS